MAVLVASMHLEILMAKHGWQATKLDVSAEVEVEVEVEVVQTKVKPKQEVPPTKCCWAQMVCMLNFVMIG